MKQKPDDRPMDELLKIMAKLRSDGGCPWDRKQTHDSLVPYLLEEAYEVASAVTEKNPSHLAEELGDVLLQIVFHSQIASELGTFTFKDVVLGLISKLIRRHPHIFGNIRVETPDDVVRNWNSIKQTEASHGKYSSILEAIPKNYPQLLYAQKCQERAAEVGFDWDHIEQVDKKVLEEWEELQAAREQPANQAHIEEEFGDLLCALVNLGRFLKINAEEALRKSNEKFVRRFQILEKTAGGPDQMKKMTLEELDGVWNDIKRQEHPIDI